MVRGEELGGVLDDVVRFHDQHGLEEVRQEGINIWMMVQVGIVLIHQIFLNTIENASNADVR